MVGHAVSLCRRAFRALSLAAAGLCASAPAALAQSADTDTPRAVLVTGTSTGIGLKMAEVLSAEGFFVYAGARDEEDLARLDTMENVKAVRLDVTVQSEIDDAVELIRSEGRGLYGLINNAGVAVMGPLIELPEDDLAFQLDVNLLGPYRITKALADLLIESGGRVLTVSSIAGVLSGPYSGAYSMSKHGVEAYTDALAAELERFGVAVAAVEPGNYKSQILASMVRRMRESGYSAEGSRYGSMIDMATQLGPLDRSQYEEPDDVARAALDFLTSQTPHRRYMVVPNQSEAAMTIRQALLETVQLNQGHRFTYSRDDLVRMLDEALAAVRPAPAPVARAEAGPAAEAPGGLAVHEAVLRGDPAALRALLEAGADPNAREPSGGSTPLITAATFGRTEAARTLIDAGADLDLQNDDGSTALITAAFFARTDIVQALLDAGADRSIRNNTGSTALDAVTAPFEAVRGIYDAVGAALAPYGLELDYEQIEVTRPVIAEMLK